MGIKNRKKIIVVNNPAARSGGALTILKEFLKKTSELTCSHNFFVFVSLEELKKYETDKLKIIVIPSQGFKARIYWDNFGLKNFLKLKNIAPDMFLSIQNTGVNLEQKIPQIIYYHQLLSIVDLKWNIFKKEERIFWMYKNIYPFFINQHLDKVKKIIVQTEWVKDLFSKKFKYNNKNIVLMRPTVKEINIEKINNIPKNKFRIFYPSTPIVYKNHKVIIEALEKLEMEIPKLEDSLECVFTFSQGESEIIDRMIREKKLENIIKLIGKIPYERVLEYYKSSDLMVFPSYLETFGLPLVEAQKFNLDIITVDLPYAREVIGNYEKIKFIKFDEEWEKEISKRIKRTKNNG